MPVPQTPSPMMTYFEASLKDPRIKTGPQNRRQLDSSGYLFNLPIEITIRESLFYCSNAKEGDHNKAIALYTRALEIDPQNIWALVNRGDLWRRLNKHNKAIADYNTALEITPTPFLYHERGESCFEAYDLDQCIADFTKVLEIDPNFTSINYERGIAFTEKGELDRAIVDFTKDLEIVPDDAWAYFSRGWAWAKKGNYDRAIADYNIALQMDSRHAWAYYNRGKARANNGDFDGATADYNEALKINPNVDKAFSYRDFIIKHRIWFDRLYILFNAKANPKDDKFHGHVVYTYPGCIKYEGEFKDGKFHGYGVAISRDGRKVHEYKDGEIIKYN